MEKAIIGKKIGMTQIFDEAGHAVPVTVIEAGPLSLIHISELHQHLSRRLSNSKGYYNRRLGFCQVLF